MATPTRSDVSNLQIANDLGHLSHSSISRIRSGDRVPTYETIWRIHEVYSWPIFDQVEAILNKTYPAKFEQRLNLHYFGPASAAE